MEIEYLYRMESYLNNVLFFKFLYDEGFEMKEFANCYLGTFDYYSTIDPTMDNFICALDKAFDLVDIISMDSVDSKEKLNYWFSQCGTNVKMPIYDSSIGLIIMDSNFINHFQEPDLYLDVDVDISYYYFENGIFIIVDFDFYESFIWIKIFESLWLYKKNNGGVPNEVVI